MGLFSKRSNPAPENATGTVERPLFERIHDYLLSMEMGPGQMLFRLAMFGMVMLFVLLVYTGSQFHGLDDKDAMDLGQLGRNLSRGRGYMTQFIRPVELGHLEQSGRPPLDQQRLLQPEVWKPPVYPWLLAKVFLVVKPDWAPEQGSRVRASDRVMIAVSLVCFVVGLILTYLVAQMVFDRKVAVMSAFLYLFCDPLLDYSISGLPMNFLVVLLMVSVYVLLKMDGWQEDPSETARGTEEPVAPPRLRPLWWSLAAAVVAAIAVAVGTLTQYTFAAVVVPFLWYTGSVWKKHWWVGASIALLVMALLVAPWIRRNQRVCGKPFGLSYYELYEDVKRGTPDEIKPGQLQRTYDVRSTLANFKNWFVVREFFVNWRLIYDKDLKDVGGGFLAAFFAVSLLHGFKRPAAARLRRFVVLAVLATATWMGASGPGSHNFLTLFAPLVIIFAVAYFYVLVNRLQLQTRLQRVGVIGLFVLANTAGFAFTILPPRKPMPYPPYDGTYIWHVGKGFAEDNLVVSDIPWAVAWYGDRSCVWSPYSEKDYFTISDNLKFLSGIYVTQLGLHEFDGAEVAAALVAREPIFWLRGFPLLMPPQSFPLQSREVVTPDRQQFLISSGRRVQ